MTEGDTKPPAGLPAITPTQPSDPVQRTLAYYDQHAEEFIERTANVDLRHVYEPFLALVPKGGHILDAGCGSGRDAAEFVRRGYKVTAFDGSAELAKLAAKHSGLSVLHLTFDAVNWQNEFDGVWACASLLHLPTPELQDALLRLVAALKPQGVLFASLKAGPFEGEREGRWFTDTTTDRLLALVRGTERLEVVRIWETVDARPDHLQTRWVNALARRTTRGDTG